MGDIPHILLVEDDDLDARLVTTFLERGNVRHTLLRSRSVATARDLLARQEFDLVLVDHYIADGLGLDLIASLDESSGPPCVLLTGSTTRGLDEQALRAGAIDYLDKGELSPTALRTVVRQALARQTRREKIREMAFTDGLTGLANRIRLMQDLDKAIARARRRDGRFGVLYMDLDGFKPINDTLGHQAGDQLLVEVASRLKALVRETDTVARLGGDEFVVLLDDITSPEDGMLSAARIRDRLEQAVELDAGPAKVGVSIGVATWPLDGEDPAALLEAADQGMYQTKRGRKASASKREAPSRTAHSLEHELKRAVMSQGFDLSFQPRIDLGTGTLMALEARLRWSRHNTPLRAQDFVPALEALGLVTGVDCWVARQAASVVARLRARTPELRLAVNLSAAALADAKHVDRVTQTLRELDLPTDAIEIQLDASPAQLEEASRWKDMGVRIVGCGAALNLAGWRDLLGPPPLHALELDVRTTTRLRAPGGAAVAAATVALARSLDLTVVAAGAEDLETLQRLSALGVDEAQGHAVARPMSTAELQGWLERRAA